MNLDIDETARNAPAVTAWKARKLVAAHRRGEHEDGPGSRKSDCRLCRASVSAFLRYGVGLSESELRLLDGNR
jgi:hypothetical protein